MERGHKLAPQPLHLERSDDGAVSTIYLSPSVRENSTVDQAKANYNREPHTAQVALANKVGHGARAGIGVWSDGAEESTAFYAKPGEADRAAALVALKAKQKAALIFTPGKGNASRYSVSYPATSFDRAMSAFQDAGVPHHTHFPAKAQGTAELTHVVSDDKDLPAKVASAAKNLGGKVDMETGEMKFLGHESDRELAKQEFIRILQSRLAAR